LKKEKKIFILISDGVGIRNYAFSGFYKKASQYFNINYWNGTVFPLKQELELPEKKLPPYKPHILIDLIKSIKQHAEVLYFSKKFKDKAYINGIRLPQGHTLNKKIKRNIIQLTKYLFANSYGICFLDKIINRLAKSTPYFKEVKKQLQKEKPSMLLSTHQRPLQNLEPVLAAKELDIPTLGFIFSWDNLPKATLNIKTDYYMVWSEYMKKELLTYYPEIKEKQIFVTGTPQFEIHFNDNLKMKRNEFFNWIGVPADKKYICFSGDDKRTSPNDPFYLEDLAKAVKKHNQKNKEKIGILFRPVPVDFSDRYKKIEKKYADIIMRVQPLWKKASEHWSNYFPTANDNKMLYNLAEHCEAVFNVGSSMVFDFVAHDKPTAYFNYDTEKKIDKNWSYQKIYKFIHFKSMPDKKAVLWVNSPKDYEKLFEVILLKKFDLSLTKKWFDTINLPPQNKASERIVQTLNKLI